MRKVCDRSDDFRRHRDKMRSAHDEKAEILEIIGDVKEKTR
jgi:hypothetical protein